jgi:uncharacterized protein (TIGR00251 family)
MRPPEPYVRTADGLRLHVRATPNAGTDTIDGRHVAADGAMSLKVRVAAQPEKGRANKAVITLLAKALGRPRSALEVTGGLKDRNKTVAIEGDFEELARALDALLQE